MTKATKDHSTLISFILAIALSIASVVVWVNNDYSTYRDVPVTFIDKFTKQSCHKGLCNDDFYGVFKTETGKVFDRPISAYMYRQMHIQEKFTLNLRPFDIQQNSWDNTFWVFGALILHILTAFTILFFVDSACCDLYTARNPKPKER